MVYLHDGILFSHEKEQTLTPATTWVNPENMVLSERSQTQKTTGCVIPLIGNIPNKHIYGVQGLVGVGNED